MSALLASVVLAAGAARAQGAAEPALPRVVASGAGVYVAVLSTWIDEGPGFPNARIEVFHALTGLRTHVWQVRLEGPDAARGTDGAIADVAARAESAFGQLGISPQKEYAGARCAPLASGGASCGAHRVTVTSTRSAAHTAKDAQCFGRAGPDLLRLVVDERVWVEESFPAEGCPSAWRPLAVYEAGNGLVTVLAYDVPGHEGTAARTATVVGPR